ncbi:App1 family protein [Glaciecola sp. MH2013]|uniref:phosphatidate phosphatase App1 family protein n=1 Tax=Glaciecola sp. MH2013 TaxID=2785524 RepID=UPI00189E9A17|nr:App1 family protein [Glaciecola sp. MH2013]MBF7074178.1 App1 family protein [Glaciecola sp. MH2013]
MHAKRFLKRSFLISSFLWLNACAAGDFQDQALSVQENNIAPDEVLQFFTTDAFLRDANGDGTGEWQIPVHAWVYEPADSQVRMKVVKESLWLAYDIDIDNENAATFEHRINQFLVDNERGKWFTIALKTKSNLASKNLYRVGKTQENGQVLSYFTASNVDEDQDNKAFIQSIQYCTRIHSREVCGRARLIPQYGISVISDIDDTVKISEVKSKKALLENTFLNSFSAVPNIAEVYSSWSEQGVSFHYVSSSPWYLYSELESFLQLAGFPDFSLSLKSFRFRDESLLALFKDGEATKPAQLRQILDKYPQRQFVLIGDSGEQDPEVYTSIKLQYPEQIIGIYIRDLAPNGENTRRIEGLVERMGGFPILLFQEASSLPSTIK